MNLSKVYELMKIFWITKTFLCVGKWFQGMGGAEEGEVISKKNPVGSKTCRAGTFMFGKKVHKEYTDIHRVYFQSASVICSLGFT